ncbi:MAG: hypothetical protein GF417_06590 [Candidatus Latescibacteria bacterium]|nr:hypothetical protein [bacterium]MBD3424085.1 hypothetical protein [Candidatus Latescibacterota bacterium]
MVTDVPKMEMNLAEMENGQTAEFRGGFRHKLQELDCDVNVEATLTVMEGSYLIEAETSCLLSGCCDRCLNPVEERVHGTVEILLRRTAAEENGEQDESLPAVSPEQEVSYDIFPRVLQFLLLEIPQKIICSTDCQGLCPLCGKNLNEGECQCEEQEGDPRWEPLKKLMNDQ